VLGPVPKTYLPNYREFYEKRQFTSGRRAVSRDVLFLGKRVAFGNDLIFNAINVDNLSLHVEICEDVWVPIPPSTYAALGGATVLANLSASNITIGKAEYRRGLCASQSGRCIAAYLYSAAGPGESTTDLAWDGHALIYENNELLAEAERFSPEEQMIAADLDLGRLTQERMRMTSFNDSVDDHSEQLRAIRRVEFDFQVPAGEIAPMRSIDRFPYVPHDPASRDRRCYEAYNIQIQSLMKRFVSIGVQRLVIGVSGGLDSTQALIVAAKTMDRLGLASKNILAYSMPGFAHEQRDASQCSGFDAGPGSDRC
jgi:NAD+ synthase (glutamine-hydrolysing)